MENYEIINPIGKGNFGKITKILRKSDKKILVWKELNYSELSDKEKQQIVSEVNILRELKHPNIVKYYDRIIDKKNQKIYIIMEYCEGGDLNELIKRLKNEKKNISEDIIWKIFTQVLLAVNFCHKHKEGKILHRDIKPSNIFLDKDSNVKLGDFGLSRELSNESKFAYSNVGTPYYMSPEQIEENKYNEKSDIWSLGCFLYEITTFNPPFEAKNQIQLGLKIKSGIFDKINNKYSDDLWKVIKWMINVDPINRPSSDDLLNIPQVSIRLKEMKIKESLIKIKIYENNLKCKERDLENFEKRLLEREKKILEKENELNEREKMLNGLNNIILNKKNISVSTNNSSENNLNNFNTHQNSNVELSSNSNLMSNCNLMINQNNLNDDKNFNNDNNSNNGLDDEKYCILLPSDKKKLKSLTVPISVNTSIKFNDNYDINCNNNKKKKKEYIEKFPINKKSKNSKSKIIKYKKEYSLQNINPNSIKKNIYEKKYKMNIAYTSREIKNNNDISSSFKFNPSIYYKTNELKLNKNLKTESNKKNIENGLNDRANTPKITSIKTSYKSNNTPKRKNMNNKNINTKNNTPNNYYSKYIRRNNSGVSINKMIDNNRINSKKIYSNIIPRKYY